MSEEKKQVRYDLDGADVITTAIMGLLNQYPKLKPGDEITFSNLDETSGKAMLPISGAVIESEKKSVTGKVIQICKYPFYVVWRGKGFSEERKAEVKEWLDDLGRWLEKQEIAVDGQKYHLSEYPPLTGQRKFLSISRQEPGYLGSETEDHTEDWVIHISARYQNEFHK